MGDEKTEKPTPWEQLREDAREVYPPYLRHLSEQRRDWSRAVADEWWARPVARPAS